MFDIYVCVPRGTLTTYGYIISTQNKNKKRPSINNPSPNPKYNQKTKGHHLLITDQPINDQ